MKGNIITARWNTILSSVLRFLLVFFAFAVLAGIKFPFVSGEKTSFIALVVLGIAVSLASNWRFILGVRWTDPINIIGSLLGAAATLLIIFTIKDITIPFITGYKMAFLVLAVLLVLKIGLKILQDTRKKAEISP